MKAKMFTMALAVAAMMSASMSASAQTRKGDFAKGRKAGFRKEIKFCSNKCPRCAHMQKMKMMKFDARFQDPRFRDPRFRAVQFEQFNKHHKHHRDVRKF